MLTRKLDLSGIASATSVVDMARETEVSAYIEKSTTTTTTSSVKTMSNDIGDVLTQQCDSKAINKISKDYLSNLDRRLPLNPTLPISGCVGISNVMDTLLASNIVVDNTPDFTDVINSVISNELVQAGMSTSIPSCLLNGVSNRINSLFDFGTLSLHVRSDLLNLVNDFCGSDNISTSASKVLSIEASKHIINGLISSDKPKAMEYISTKAASDNSVVLKAMEELLVEKEGKDMATKLSVYNAVKKRDTDEQNNYVTLNKSLINNINDDITGAGYRSDNFEVMNNSFSNLGGVEDISVFKGKDNLSTMAKDSIATKPSEDDINNAVKNTELNLATSIVLCNLF